MSKVRDEPAPRTRILVFNFFGSVMDRGIPQYARDIVEGMRRSGHVPIELECPRFCRRLPRSLRKILFVVFEQIVAPAMRIWRGCAVTVYPYNSVGVIDAILGRSVLVIHDLIPNARKSHTLATRYICATQAVHCLLGRPICAASEHTLTQLRRIRRFSHSALHLWSNPFYQFERALADSNIEFSSSSSRPMRILLCSGMTPNKDYPGALRLFTCSGRLRDAELFVLGFGDDAHLARRRVARLPSNVRRRIVILPRLSLEEVAAEYLMCDVVWVHSKNEGFGRSVIEGRLGGRPVIASRIRAFARLAAPGITYYQNATFDRDIVPAFEPDQNATCMNITEYHTTLENSICSVIALFGARDGTQPAEAGSAGTVRKPMRLGVRESR